MRALEVGQHLATRNFARRGAGSRSDSSKHCRAHCAPGGAAGGELHAVIVEQRDQNRRRLTQLRRLGQLEIRDDDTVFAGRASRSTRRPFGAGGRASSGVGARRWLAGRASSCAAAGNGRTPDARSPPQKSLRRKLAHPRRPPCSAPHASAVPKRWPYSATRSSRSPSQPKQVVHARVVSRSSFRSRTYGMAAMISSRVSHSQKHRMSSGSVRSPARQPPPIMR